MSDREWFELLRDPVSLSCVLRMGRGKDRKAMIIIQNNKQVYNN